MIIWKYILKIRYENLVIYDKNVKIEEAGKISNKISTDCEILEKEVLNNARKR